jgi:hypothetical protein
LTQGSILASDKLISQITCNPEVYLSPTTKKCEMSTKAPPIQPSLVLPKRNIETFSSVAYSVNTKSNNLKDGIKKQIPKKESSCSAIKLLSPKYYSNTQVVSNCLTPQH